MLRGVVLLLGWLYVGLSWGSCGPQPLTAPDQIHIPGEELLIVVHASSTFDARFTTKRGVDEAIKFAKEKKIPIIYLQDDSPEQYYFMADCQPNYWVFSAGGEIRFPVTARHLYIVGGHLELCLSTALHDIIYQWAKRPAQNYTITYFMDAIYSNGKLIDPSDPFYHDFDHFLSVVTYGRPGGEHWPKLSLLETMGIIRSQAHELNYLKQTLPRWDTTFPSEYRIELQLNDSVKKVLRSAEGWNPPTVLFQFLDSALLLSEPQTP